MPYAQIADKYGISKGQVSRLNKYKNDINAVRASRVRMMCKKKYLPRHLVLDA